MRNVSHHHKQGKQQQTSRAKRWIGWGASLLICLHGTLAWAGHAFYDYANPLPAAEIEVVYSAWTSYPYGGLNNPYPSAAAACAVNKLSLIAGFVGTSPSAGAASCAYGFNCYYNLQDCLFTNYNFPGDIGITTSGNAYQIPSCPAGYTMMTRPTGQFACRKNNAIPDCPTPKIRPDIAFKFVAFTQNYGSVYPGICERWYCPNPAENPVPQNQGGITVMECVPNETYTLTLTPGTSTIEPVGLPWNTLPTNTALLAKVVNQRQEPKPGIEVKLSVSVEQGSGGHLHHPDRELGFLLNVAGSANCGTAGNPLDPCVSGTTGPDGTTGFIYAASQLSGTYTITATCAKCSNSPVSSTVTVKLDNLETIPASPGNCYTLTDAQGTIGAVTGQHTDNHWVRKGVPERLEKFACKYFASVKQFLFVPEKRLFINDSSLVWGGRFEPHDSHRFGWSIDIRANSSVKKVGEVPFTLARNLLTTNKSAAGKASVQIHCTKPDGSIGIASKVSPKLCDNYSNNRHLHVDFK